MHWKIERDPYYNTLSDRERGEAGFIFDSSIKNVNLKDTLDERITPVQWLKNNFNPKQTAILIISGAFAPFHEGHLTALITARRRLLQQYKYNQVFAFVSPDHDEYIGFKAHSGFAIDERIHEIRKKIKDFPWIRLDLWPALCASGSINFTDVVRRLGLYIKKHYVSLPVFYVAGGDNAKFALAFKNRGNCVIVGRPGNERAFKKYAALADDKRIFFADAGCPYSSTELRTSYRSDFYNPTHLILRVDETKPLEWLAAEVIKPFFNSCEVITVGAQKELFKNIEGNVISLDPLIKAKYNFEASRNYDFGGMDLLGFVPRPGAKTFYLQQLEIPAGQTYTLYDDDICSGATMDFVCQNLARSRAITKQISFTNGAAGVEVLDARDFIWGAGGLVINNKRETYELPRVVPSVRCSIKHSKQFSDAIRGFNLTISNSEVD